MLRAGKAARKASGRRTLIAGGRRKFATAGTARLRLRLTRAGKRVTRHPKRTRVEIQTRFAPILGASVGYTAHLNVPRRPAGATAAAWSGWSIRARSSDAFG
jgi:hypothetical protein